LPTLETFARPRLATCAGAYNCVQGKKKNEVCLYAKYIAPPDMAVYEIGSYNGLPAIKSVNCTGVGKLHGKDGGLVCARCKDVCALCGSSNPIKAINKSYFVLSKAIERRNKGELTKADFKEASNFYQTPTVTLNLEGWALKEEANAQVQYFKSMKRLDKDLRWVLLQIVDMLYYNVSLLND
jgi:hypothetical protein